MTLINVCRTTFFHFTLRSFLAYIIKLDKISCYVFKSVSGCHFEHIFFAIRGCLHFGIYQLWFSYMLNRKFSWSIPAQMNKACILSILGKLDGIETVRSFIVDRLNLCWKENRIRVYVLLRKQRTGNILALR